MNVNKYMSGYFIFRLLLTVIIIYTNSAVCTNVCSIHPTLNFYLIKEGFHRELDFTLEIKVDQDSIWNGSQIVFEQTIPSGCYANPDELAELRRMNKVMACPVGDVNVESPEHESTLHVVHIYIDLQHAGNILTAVAKLPVHLRYHRATVGGIPATVLLEPPSLLLRSNSSLKCGQRREAPCGPCHQDVCEWFSVPYKSDTKLISVTVPVGNLNHARFVTVITLFITIASALYVFKTVMDSTRAAAARKSK